MSAWQVLGYAAEVILLVAVMMMAASEIRDWLDAKKKDRP